MTYLQTFQDQNQVDVSLAAGNYAVTETKPLNFATRHQYAASYSSDCVGTINNGSCEIASGGINQPFMNTSNS